MFTQRQYNTKAVIEHGIYKGTYPILNLTRAPF